MSISHAIVLPDKDFFTWLQVLGSYMAHFDRVAVIRSPAGNDLNRFQNITAVNAPLMWIQDDPVFHIRRIYPSVVRVDVLSATTPKQLGDMLAVRVRNDDRYGEKNGVRHIFDRFTILYPTRHRPLGILTRFEPQTDPNHIGVEILARPGAPVLAGVSGRVREIWNADTPSPQNIGRYVQIEVVHDGKTYLVTYASLSLVQVSVNQVVQPNMVVAAVEGGTFRLIVQHPPLGVSARGMNNLIDPSPLIYVPGLRVRPTNKPLNVRTIPSLQGRDIGDLFPHNLLEPLEPHGRVLEKVVATSNDPMQWLRLRLPDGRPAFSAANFLNAEIRNEVDRLYHTNPLGVNLDFLNPAGKPPESALGQLGWVRINYNVSAAVGSEDIEAAFRRYFPMARRYKDAGYRVMFVATHQLYGEGKLEFWPWAAMTDEKWTRLIDRYASMMGRVALQWQPHDIVDCWQIWNEQDALAGAVASVPVPTHIYASMLARTIRAIRRVDRDVYIITGGHNGGPGRGAQYARESLAMLPLDAYVDGIAIHPYGRGAVADALSPFGRIDDSIEQYGKIYPNRPLWITEWGLLDQGQRSTGEVADYAEKFYRYLQDSYPGRIATMVWYAWAEGMHNGYGIVDRNGNPRPPLTQRFLNLNSRV